MAVRLCVLGDGGWGTALALHLHQRGHRVALWGAFAPYVAQINRTRRNPKYLPGVRLPASVRVTADIEEAIEKTDGVVVAVPSQYLRSVVSRLKGLNLGRRIVISVAKGIEVGTQLRMSQIIEQELGQGRLGVLSGPSIASEVAAGKPASLVAASESASVARQIQAWFMDSRLRIYTSADVVGVEPLRSPRGSETASVWEPTPRPRS
jgi:glycerol-3-phosphate dehydrogenase (NAD(P)+)